MYVLPWRAGVVTESFCQMKTVSLRVNCQTMFDFSTTEAYVSSTKWFTSSCGISTDVLALALHTVVVG